VTDRATPGQDPVILEGVWKSFAGRPVLRDISLELRSGEVHALVGANGAGKSTLVKILSGNTSPEQGRIMIGGAAHPRIASPRQAADLGVRVVHQEAPLFDTLSVTESIALFSSYQTGPGWRIRWGATERGAAELLERFGVDTDPEKLGGQIGAADRALIAIAVTLGSAQRSETSLLILDEASAAVPEDEASRFLGQVRKLASEGMPVLMVTHRLSEVFEIADKVTVLHNGAIAYSGPMTMSRQELVRLIAGNAPGEGEKLADGDELGAGRERGAAQPVLSVRNLSTPHIRDLSFVLRRGEILGFVGGPESGVLDLPLALTGALDAATDPGAQASGLEMDGTTLPLPTTPREALAVGICLVPRDRLRQGLIGSLSIQENILLPTLRRYWHRGKTAKSTVRDLVGELDVRPPNPQMLGRELSGGNQQKVIIGKWLNCGPRVLVLDDPTVGIDPVARETIFSVLRRRAKESGLGVFLLSSEPEQLVQQCDRVIALKGGRAVAEYTRPNMPYSEIARWATT
jgi:ABC-type sugar transport system ATPase subunit